ncbi:SpoU rRNA Methylase family [Nesidiocoris tenuis]|nr:SpoU rRNA Methylase family [Nesidiocoris tenuis]
MVSAKQTRNLAEIVNLSASEVSRPPDIRGEPAGRHPAQHPFVKLDFNSPVFTKALLKVKGRKPREKHGLILLEGWRLVQEALDCGCKMDSIFFSRVQDLNKLRLPEDASEMMRLYKVPYNDMKAWSSVTTPPGIIAICQIPSPVPETRESLPLTVICDQIREPGNLGSIIRNSAGAGVRRVILTPGCTDLWDGKTLRGAAGAHFKVRVRPNVSWSEIGELVNREESRLMLASPAASDDGHRPFMRDVPTLQYWEPDYTERHNFIVIGGETEGISDEAFELAVQTEGCQVTIPLANNVESLNSVAAASIIMFEIKKQMMMVRRTDDD